MLFVFFFFNDTATTEIYTLSLHDALPICAAATEPTRTTTVSTAQPLTSRCTSNSHGGSGVPSSTSPIRSRPIPRSEEHTSELQSRQYLVCRLLLEKKKKAQP